MATVVFGGTGMVGHALQEIAPNFTYLSSSDCNLLKPNEIRKALKGASRVINLAADVGGLYKNMSQMKKMYLNNLQMSTNFLSMCDELNINHVVTCLSMCVYPDGHEPVEGQIHCGPPHSSHYGYAHAKRMGEVHTRLINDSNPSRRYVTVSPTNIYGPFDNFSLTDAHVVPMLIHKAHLAKNGKLVIRGTGVARRQFIYSKDVAKLLLIILNHIDDKACQGDIILSPPIDYGIRSVALWIAADFDLSVEYDPSFTDGQQRIPTKAAKLQNLLNNWNEDFTFTQLVKGLTETTEWFKSTYPAVRGAVVEPKLSEMYEITFLKNGLRLENFINNNRVLGGKLQCFPAVDTMQNVPKYLNKYIQNGAIDGQNKRLIQSCQMLPGKIGCNASYFELFSKLVGKPGWYLILEDDVVLSEKLNFDAIIAEAEKVESNYVKLITFKQFAPDQFNAKHQFSEHLFRKVYDWGTGAQLISQTGIKILMDNRPWDAIDETINTIPALKATTWKNSAIEHLGMECTQLRPNQPYGSLIYNQGLEQKDTLIGFPAKRPVYYECIHRFPQLSEIICTLPTNSVVAIFEAPIDPTNLLEDGTTVYYFTSQYAYQDLVYEFWKYRELFIPIWLENIEDFCMAILTAPKQPTHFCTKHFEKVKEYFSDVQIIGEDG